MRKSETKKYEQLNELSEPKGIVIFGNNEDKSIPIGELRQAFSIESKLYNRSFENLSIREATKVYEENVAPLSPETLLIHIGESDKNFFSEHASEFDTKYCELIHLIKSQNPKCRIGIVSLRNYENNPLIEKMNRHLNYIANSERCEYGDIANKKVWNPKSTMDTTAFIYSIGFVHPLKNKRPLYDLIKILFCYKI